MPTELRGVVAFFNADTYNAESTLLDNILFGKRAYGAPVKIFTRADVEEALGLAQASGLTPTGPLDLECTDKVVRWDELDLDFTFLVFSLRKVGSI